MMTFGLGQRAGQIVQMAYVVQRMQPAIDWWITDGRAGPSFLLDSFTGSEQRYRGKPTKADVSIAMGFAGHMMIELIQPKDNGPSVYKEIIDQRGYGFHHVGIAFEDVEAERLAYEGAAATSPSRRRCRAAARCTTWAKARAHQASSS